MFSAWNQDGMAVRRCGAGPIGLVVSMFLLAAVAVAGCSEEGWSMGGWERGASKDEGSSPSASPAQSSDSAQDGERQAGGPSFKGTITVPATAAGEAADDAPLDAEMSQLHQRVQAYVNRFPESDLAQKVNGGGGEEILRSAQDDRRVALATAGAGDGSTPFAAAGSQEPGLRITPIVEQESPVESDQAASPSKPSGANAIRIPDSTEGSAQPEVSASSINDPEGARLTEPGQTGDASSEDEPSAGWTVSDRAADEGEAWPAVTGQPAKVPSQPGSSRSAVQLIDVRPAGDESGSGTAVVKSDSPANQPVAKAENSTSGMGEYMRELEERVAQNPNQFDELYKLRLLYAATGQRAKALAPVKDLDEAHGELLQAMLNVITLGDQVLTEPSASARETLAAVDELGRLLRQQSPVIIANVAMVTRVNSFGDYVAVDPPIFEQGSPVHVFVYTEIANFRSQPTADGRLRTVLSESVQVFDSSGKVVWERSVPEFEDRTLTPRRDFFYPFEVKLPADLPAGQYALKVTVEDKLSATTDQQRITFSIQ